MFTKEMVFSRVIFYKNLQVFKKIWCRPSRNFWKLVCIENHGLKKLTKLIVLFQLILESRNVCFYPRFPFGRKLPDIKVKILWKVLIINCLKDMKLNHTKGQLISKCLYEVIVWTKIPTKNLIISALKIFIKTFWNQLTFR